MRDNQIQQVAQIQKVHRGNANRVADAQLIEVVNAVHHADVVNLVDDQYDRLA